MTQTHDRAILRVGWLLASLAPQNVAKGERLLARLSEADRATAEGEARCLVALYAMKGGPNARAAYANHNYFTEEGEA